MIKIISSKYKPFLMTSCWNLIQTLIFLFVIQIWVFKNNDNVSKNNDKSFLNPDFEIKTKLLYNIELSIQKLV